MDIISHALLANLVFKELPLSTRWWAIAFGILPDILGFIGVFKLDFFKKLLFFKKIPQTYYPKFVFVVYNIMHSLLIWAIIWMLLYFVLQWHLAALLILSWGLHIVVDIFTHNDNSNLATRIFWPVSNWHFYGLSWSNWKFLLFNYLVWAVLYLIFYF